MVKRYSHSALDSYRTCPRKFKFQYVDKVKTPKRVTADAYMGNAVHRALHKLYDAVGFGKVLTLDQLIDIYKQEWDKPEQRQIEVFNENLGVDDYIASGRTMLERYYERYRPFDEGITLCAEKNLQFTLPGTPFSLSAIIDRLWKRPDGSVEICDYKTGSHLPTGARDPRFFFQMGIYQLAVMETYPQFADITVAQYYLKLDEVVSYKMTPDDIDLLTLDLKNTIHETIQSERLNDFPTQESGLCRYCEYHNLCPAKRHRLLLESEEGKDGKDEVTSAEAASRLAEKFLEVDASLKELKAEHEALKEDLTKAVQDLGVNKLTAEHGEVTVKLSPKEKFITRSQDKGGFADLSYALREMGLEDYFEPNTREIMKSVYAKGLLNEEQMARLKEYVICTVDRFIRAKHTAPEEEE